MSTAFERQRVPTLRLAANGYLAPSINAVDLENRFRDV
jgi:hypothetical protein